jgi:hypothetical protein
MLVSAFRLATLLGLGFCKVASGNAADPGLVRNGDFDTSACAEQHCEYWKLNGPVRIVTGGKAISDGSALAFAPSRELGSAIQAIVLRPGAYDLTIRFFKDCAADQHMLAVISVGPTILMTRIFEGISQCGWQKLSKSVYLQVSGQAEFAVRVRTLEAGRADNELLIDAIELVARQQP